MRKLIIPIVIASLLFTSGAVIDGLDNQDMTEPESHFWEMNPIKYNTYKKGQCTYYVCIR
ncbi:secretory antigen SsaA [Staphylococcus saccharolyticus]|uniref:Secretory antigen SsaA n=1 Tax=Staphylococcus saccharolyticus TaxID=33028 RepID=A0A380H7U9_9STAP|nr:secretory antigen SsaA [Staphylococcus saccharolyticus]